MKQALLVFGLFMAGTGCSSASSGPKTVTVFTDEFSKQNLEYLHASAEQILNLVNLNFSKEDIRSSYDLVKIKYRDIRPHERFERFWPIIGFLLEEARQEINPANSANSEVIIFLTGRLRFGTCLAFTKYEIFTEPTKSGEYAQFLGGYENLVMNGEGVIVMGTDTDDKDPDGAQRLALLLMHEQSHLYGVGHVQDEDSIMYRRSDLIISGDFNKAKLDLHSKRRLQGILDSMTHK